jgi:hypothetical protein
MCPGLAQVVIVARIQINDENLGGEIFKRYIRFAGPEKSGIHSAFFSTVPFGFPWKSVESSVQHLSRQKGWFTFA